MNNEPAQQRQHHAEDAAMTLLYGFVAGLLVCVPTLATMAYVSDVAGFLVGLFLLTFFVTTSIYVSEDNVVARLQQVLKAVTDLEAGLTTRLNRLQKRLEAFEMPSPQVTNTAFRPDGEEARLEAAIRMIEQILAPEHTSAPLGHRPPATLSSAVPSAPQTAAERLKV
ncbi:MAG: hypothetical protein KatS3mg131_3730 [Candidatus Tectimicrobiota bacterium]|nr:MAG: hypothetical protein KatS3mg131_3730 [Candidatus Tectomicrobia bacterium]